MKINKFNIINYMKYENIFIICFTLFFVGEFCFMLWTKDPDRETGGLEWMSVYGFVIFFLFPVVLAKLFNTSFFVMLIPYYLALYFIYLSKNK